VNYQGVGSSAGRQFYIIRQVDFAVSEIPFQPDELQKLRSAHRSFQYLPIVAGGTSVMYNLHDATGHRITNLKLDSATLAGVFTGRITRWNDPKITSQNRGTAFPDTAIVPVIRSDGSGTSAQFSAYFATMQHTIWAAFAQRAGIPPTSTSYWPEFPGSVSQRGSDGVANYVANTSTGNGSIGYVEAGYALQRGFPVVAVRNAAGNYSLPTAGNVAIALTHAMFNADRTQNLSKVYTAHEASAYPISSYSYMITPTTSADISPTKGLVLGKFILYFACGGQQEAQRLGYSPLPRNLVLGDFAAVRHIPGAPSPPPLSRCDNPTIKHGLPPPSGYVGGGSSSGVGSSSGGSSGSSSSATGSSISTAGAGSSAGSSNKGSKGGGVIAGKVNGASTSGGLGTPTPGAVYPTPNLVVASPQPDPKAVARALAAADATPGRPGLPYVEAVLLVLGLIFVPLGLRALIFRIAGR
jgi:phosphate ABC transporter phosphate-binding protein